MEVQADPYHSFSPTRFRFTSGDATHVPICSGIYLRIRKFAYTCKLVHFVETKWAHSTGNFVLHDPEQEAPFFFFLENVLHAKDRTRVSCFTVLSVKHCFDTFSTLKSASH